MGAFPPCFLRLWYLIITAPNPPTTTEQQVQTTTDGAEETTANSFFTSEATEFLAIDTVTSPNLSMSAIAGAGTAGGVLLALILIILAVVVTLLTVKRAANKKPVRLTEPIEMPSRGIKLESNDVHFTNTSYSLLESSPLPASSQPVQQEVTLNVAYAPTASIPVKPNIAYTTSPSSTPAETAAAYMNAINSTAARASSDQLRASPESNEEHKPGQLVYDYVVM